MPPLPWTALPLTLLCLLAVAALVAAEARQRPVARALAKLTASAAFVALGVALAGLPPASDDSRWLLLGLVLSALGDACLLSHRKAWFLAGLGSFLLAHLAFGAAFACGPLDPALLWGLPLPLALAGAGVMRWLWPHLRGAYRGAVLAYVVAILGMVTLALAHAGATGAWSTAWGALAFAASDLSVARNRFIARAFVNQAWGLPAYFGAQLLLAWSLG